MSEPLTPGTYVRERVKSIRDTGPFAYRPARRGVVIEHDGAMVRVEWDAPVVDGVVGHWVNVDLLAREVVHVLDAGEPLCRFMPGVPRDWPAGHVWTRVAEPEPASCPGCIESLRGAGRDEEVQRRPMREQGGAERHFGQRGGGSAAAYGISSARLAHVGGHDRLRVWNRGAPAGELVLAEGDGEMLALALGLVEAEREPGSVGDLYRCPKCKRETPHVHEHDTAHGIAETHMVGTERYRCLECSWASYANEMHDGRMFFELDGPKEPA